MPTDSRTAGTPPDTNARRIVSLHADTEEYGHYITNHACQNHPQLPHKHKRGVGNDWNFVGHLWNYFWKMKYGLKNFIISERLKLDINKCNDKLRKCNDRLRKFTENSLNFKITVKIYLILRTEIWNMSPEIFQKLEIWALIFLSWSLKFHWRFWNVTYPSNTSMFNSDGDIQTQAKSYPQRLIIQLIAQRKYRESPNHAPAPEEVPDSNRAFTLESACKAWWTWY